MIIEGKTSLSNVNSSIIADDTNISRELNKIDHKLFLLFTYRCEIEERRNYHLQQILSLHWNMKHRFSLLLTIEDRHKSFHFASTRSNENLSQVRVVL